jgi:prepilin peptidase CpaA
MAAASLVVLTAGLAVAVVADVRSRRIPNWLTATIAAAGFVLAFTHFGSVSPGQAALGLLLGLGLMLPGHVIGATGAGDVKLMAAVGAVVGPSMAFNAFLGSALAGGVLALLVAFRRGRLHATLLGTRQLLASPSEGRQAIESAGKTNRFAYGPAIAVGTLAAVLMR